MGAGPELRLSASAQQCVRAPHRVQCDLEGPIALAAAQPPDGPLPDAPVVLLPRQQLRRHLAQRGLMAADHGA